MQSEKEEEETSHQSMGANEEEPHQGMGLNDSQDLNRHSISKAPPRLCDYWQRCLFTHDEGRGFIVTVI